MVGPRYGDGMNCLSFVCPEIDPSRVVDSFLTQYVNVLQTVMYYRTASPFVTVADTPTFQFSNRPNPTPSHLPGGVHQVNQMTHVQQPVAPSRNPVAQPVDLSGHTVGAPQTLAIPAAQPVNTNAPFGFAPFRSRRPGGVNQAYNIDYRSTFSRDTTTNCGTKGHSPAPMAAAQPHSATQPPIAAIYQFSAHGRRATT